MGKVAKVEKGQATNDSGARERQERLRPDPPYAF
jgi:hypothetical protein